jgi:hypothetical protein
LAAVRRGLLPILVNRTKLGANGEGMYRVSQRSVIRAYFMLVVWALLLTPSLPTMSGIPSVRFDDVLLILAPGVVAVTFSRVFLDRRVVLILFIALSFELGIFSGAMLGYPASMLDHFFLLRLAKYIGAIVLASALVFSEGSNENATKWIAGRTCVPGILLVVVVLQQYFNIWGLNASYVEFVAPTKYETLVGDYRWPRPVGMVGNPNELSFLLGVLCLVATWMVFKQEKSRLIWGSLALVFLAAAGLTMSRSGVFATAVALAFLLGGQLVRGFDLRPSCPAFRKGTITLSAGMIVVFLVSAATVYSNDALYEKIMWRFSSEYYGSFYRRIENWNENIQLWQESPLFGVGTLKRSDVLEHAADNEWLLLARTGGILLVSMIVSLFATGLFRKSLGQDDKRFSRSLIVGAVLYMIPAAFFYSLVIMPLALMFLTVATPSPWRVLKMQKPGIGASPDQSTNVGPVSV